MPSVPSPCPPPVPSPVTCFTDAVGTRYLSAQVTITNACPFGSSSSDITLTMPVGAYASYTSQEEADAEALAAGILLGEALRERFPCVADNDLLLLEDDDLFILENSITLSLS